jgi:hypothetical protein
LGFELQHSAAFLKQQHNREGGEGLGLGLPEMQQVLGFADHSLQDSGGC